MLLFSRSVMFDSFATPWTVVCQGPVSMGFPRQEYWSGLPFLSPGGFPDPGIEPLSPALAGGFFTTEPPGKPSVPSDDITPAVSKFSQNAVCCSFLCFDFPGGSDGKASAYNAGDPGSIPGSGRSPGVENGNPLQYSCLENPMDGGAWLATVHGVAKSRTRLSGFTSVQLFS